MASYPRMSPWSRRPLTDGEWGQLSPGLGRALRAAGVEPRIVARPSVPALIARLWRPLPITALGDAIYWPGAPLDASADAWSMSLVQHELQHVLDYRTRRLTRLGYLLSARNWVYRYRLGPDASWSMFGAEQRAQIAQDFWLAERGLLKADLAPDLFRAVIPWARDDWRGGT